MGSPAIFKGKVVKFLVKAGILLPQREQTERSVLPENGEIGYNTTVNKTEVYENSEWRLIATEQPLSNFTFVNNQTTPANITGFVIPGTSSKYLVNIIRQTIIGNKYETLEILAVSKGSSFQISITGVGDETGVSLTVTSSGQIRYTSTDDSFHTFGQIYWKQIAVL